MIINLSNRLLELILMFDNVIKYVWPLLLYIKLYYINVNYEKNIADLMSLFSDI